MVRGIARRNTVCLFSLIEGLEKGRLIFQDLCVFLILLDFRPWLLEVRRGGIFCLGSVC